MFRTQKQSFQSMTDKEKKQVWKFFEHSRDQKQKIILWMIALRESKDNKTSTKIKILKFKRK